jgi:hypothetical protein
MKVKTILVFFVFLLQYCIAGDPTVPIPSVGSSWSYTVKHSGSLDIYNGPVYDSLYLLMTTSFPSNNFTNIVLNVRLWYHRVFFDTVQHDTSYMDTGHVENGRLINFKNPAWVAATVSGGDFIITAAWSTTIYQNVNYYLWNYDAIVYAGHGWIKDKLMIRDSIGLVLRDYDSGYLADGRSQNFGCLLTYFNGVAVDTSQLLMAFQTLPVKNIPKPFQRESCTQTRAFISLRTRINTDKTFFYDLKGRKTFLRSTFPFGIFYTNLPRENSN